MSIHTITIDDFLKLEASDHELAVEMYSREIDTLATNLKGYAHGSAEREAQLDRLARLSTLRKVHKNALEELKHDAQADQLPS